jgi:gluconolactonase
VRWRSGADGLVSPNGVGLSPDERMLYVADCMLGRLYEFEIPAPA